jgi:hypothetical protein
MMNDEYKIVKSNMTVSNIFSYKELNDLYKDIYIEIDKDYFTQSHLGRLYSILYWKKNKIENNDSVDFKIKSNLSDKILEYAQQCSDVLLQLESISFTRYSSEYGFPELPPHVDTSFKQPRLTFDIQLDGNIEWPIIIEGNKYVLKNNEALVFSGTHQVHWREKKIFNKGEYIDMLLCQFSENTEKDNSISLEFTKQIDIKQKTLKLKYEKGVI